MLSARWIFAAVLAGAAFQESADPGSLLKRSFEAGRAAALERVRAARERSAQEIKEEAAREGRLEAILKELTAKSPLKVSLPGDVHLEGVRVAAFAGGKVKLAWPQGEVEFPFELLPDATRGALLVGILSRGTPRDVLEVGKVLLKSKDYDRAARCFAVAAQKDAALAPLCPDLARIRAASKIFEGSFRAVGGTLSLRWGFSTADEGKDFAALEGAMAVKPGQGLEVSGDRLALAAVRDIPFRERVKVSVQPRESDGSAHLIGLRFVKPGGGEVVIIGALATTLKAFMVERIEDDESTLVLPPAAGATGNRLSMEFSHGRFVFRVGERSVWSGDEGGFTEVTVIVGALALKDRNGQAGKSRALFREVSLVGGVSPLWMAKKTAGYRETLLSELAREHAVRTDRPERSFELSVDLALAAAPEALRAAYPGAVAKLQAAFKSGEEADIAAARQALDAVAGLAPGRYLRGVLEEALGDLRGAAEHYEAALVILPEFPEALAARAYLHAMDGRWAPAKNAVEQALALKPDLGEGLLLRARFHHEAGEAAEAMETARTARRLSPLDPKVQARATMLANVIRGPGWTKPSAHETPNYAFRSDLPLPKLRAYAEHLEALRPVYEEALGKAAMPSLRKAPILIFDSDEGYYGYMDFTAGDRLEQTLGAFSPWYGQMALFEDEDPAETLAVLSHEGFHQYLHAIAPQVPIWFNEGMAEYVGATKVEKGKVVERGGIQKGRLNDLRAGVKYGWRPLSFERIMKESQSEFYGRHAAFKYAQAWSMIHYFMQGEGGKWKPVLQAYTEQLLAGREADVAFGAAFGKADLAAMQSGWLKHAGLPVVPFVAAGAERIVVRPSDATPAAPGLPPGGVDLVALLRSRPPSPGVWELGPAGLRSSGAEMGKLLDLRFEPGEEYDLRVGITRPVQGDGLRLGLVAGGRQFVLELDGGHEGRCFMDTLDGVGFSGNQGAVFNKCLPSGRKLNLELHVRRTGVQATVDNVTVFQYGGVWERVGTPVQIGGLSSRKTLFLESTRGEFLIDSFVSLPAGLADASNVDTGNLLTALKSKPGPDHVFVGEALKIPGTLSPYGIDLRYEPPAEYDLTIEATRQSGYHGFRIGLVVDRRPVLLVVDEAPGVCFLMDGRSGRPDPATQKPNPSPLRTGAAATIDVSVRAGAVRLSVDRRAVFEVKPDSFVSAVAPGAPAKSLRIETSGSEFLVSRAKISIPGGSGVAKVLAPKPDVPPLAEAKAQLASKDETARIQAVGWLGRIREREARQLLAERLMNDSESVRIAAARALAEQRHPQAVEALGKALRVQQKYPALTREVIGALGASDLCSAIPVLIASVEVDQGRRFQEILDEIVRIGCKEAVGALLPIWSRIEEERKKPAVIKGRANPDRREPLIMLGGPLEVALRKIAGTGPLGGETWPAWWQKSGYPKSLVGVHRCETTGKTFEAPFGKPAKCPHADPASKEPHEDYLLKHRE